ncbi:hypothetical protein [Leifsonia sp. AG29]|uniref:hypothetical protein n=1 Tax=Leifsonia sp. AG29 TaxID=2598860 RepID=UPI00131E607A|nr:hypothetical protein [Leifsonia sp. AG29]
MSALKGLAQRPPSDWALLQARVRPDLAETLKAAARASGRSYSAHLESLLEKIRADAGGKMPILRSDIEDGDRPSIATVSDATSTSSSPEDH